MPKSKSVSKLEAKIRAKAQLKAKKKSQAPSDSLGIDNTKRFPLLSQLIQDKRSILPLEALSKLDFPSKIKLIEELSQYIITSPENHISHIQTLIHLSEDDNIIIAKMGLISTAEVFKDTAPLYEINELHVKENLKKQISKDERRLFMFELNFLEAYKRYIGILSDLLKLKPKKYIRGLNLGTLEPEQKQKYHDVCKEYNRVALICLSDLISSLYHLNFKKDIASMVASKLRSFEPEIRSVAMKTIKQFFADQNPAVFEIKYCLILTISKIFGSTPEAKLPDDFLDCLNELTLQSNLVVQEDDEKAKKTIGKNNINKKRKLQHLDEETRNEIKKQDRRLRKELKEELKEAEAVIDPKKVEHFKTEILMKVFYIYFKILKFPKPSKFFAIAMNGILKFVHLISADIISDLIECLGQCGDLLREYNLKNLDDSKDLLHSRVTCIFASIEIINELGKLVELDDREAMLTLYHLFLDLCKHSKIANQLQKADQELIIKTLQKTFIQKRQLSLETTASFVKIFLDFAIKAGNELRAFSKTLMFFVKLIVQKYATLSRLLEEENQGYGLDMYNPNVEDPQATNALKTFIIDDLNKIKQKYLKDPDMLGLAKKIEGQERLPTHLSSLSPLDFFKRLSA